jgi:hypothetical protein
VGQVVPLRHLKAVLVLDPKGAFTAVLDDRTRLEAARTEQAALQGRMLR